MSLLGVSAELGMKLLTPTVGARTLLKTLVNTGKKTDAEKLKMLSSSASVANSGAAASNQTIASKLIFDHKKKLKEEKGRQVLLERRTNETPMLGRGLCQGKAGYFFTLTFSN